MGTSNSHCCILLDCILWHQVTPYYYWLSTAGVQNNVMNWFPLHWASMTHFVILVIRMPLVAEHCWTWALPRSMPFLSQWKHFVFGNFGGPFPDWPLFTLGQLHRMCPTSPHPKHFPFLSSFLSWRWAGPLRPGGELPSGFTSFMIVQTGWQAEQPPQYCLALSPAPTLSTKSAVNSGIAPA